MPSPRQTLLQKHRVLNEARKELLDAAKCYVELLIACDEMDGEPPHSVYLAVVKALELAAVAYTAAASRAGRLPKHPERCDCETCRPELYA